MPDVDGDEINPSPILLEGRDERDYFSVLSVSLVSHATEVPAECDYHEDECAPHFVDVVQV